MEMTALIGIGLAIAVGAASPGPSFIMVARTAVSASRVDAMFAAFGMGLGGLMFACLALLGLQSVLTAVPSLYVALKVVGGLYLVYLGVRIWRGAREPLHTQPLAEEELELRKKRKTSRARGWTSNKAQKLWRGFWGVHSRASHGVAGAPQNEDYPVRCHARSFGFAFATQMSNPKAAVIYASVFAAFLPASHTWAFNAAVALLVFCIEFGWYAVVALALSAARPRGVYLRFKVWIDRIAGSVMMLLGLRLVTSAR